MAATSPSLFPGLPASSPSPVVLLGGINLVRALGLGGIPVIVASPHRDDPAFSSRYCRERLHLPPLSQAGAVIEVLDETGRRLHERFGHRVSLAYGNDDYLRLVYTHRARLEKRFAMLLNEPEIGENLLDKNRFAEFARARGLPVPACLRWEAGCADSLDSWSAAVIVKPCVKIKWDDSPVLASLLGGEGKALVFPDGKAVLRDPMIGRFRDQLVFQEYIAGGDLDQWCYDGVADPEGRILAGYVGRKLRSFPPDTGDSSYVEMADNRELEALAQQIAARIPLRGIFNMDFKRDPRDGSFRLLEINARYNFWLYMSARNGINLTRVLHDFLMNGTRPGEMKRRSAYRWIDFGLDRAAYRALSLRGELTFPRWAWSLVSARKIYSVLSWSDPLPFVRHLGERLSRLRKRPETALLRLRQWLSKAWRPS